MSASPILDLNPKTPKWRDRLRAMNNIPPIMRMVWKAAPGTFVSGVGYRLVAALVPAGQDTFVVNSCPAKIPVSSRMVVPEFPASSARQLLFNPRGPRPVIRTNSFSILTSAPSALMHPSVLWQSAAAEKFRSSLVPSAKPASIA